MITYSRLTLQNVIDTAFIETEQYRTAINLDWTTVALFVNRAISETMSKTILFKDWAYVTTLNINSFPYRLPNGMFNLNTNYQEVKYLEKIRLLVKYDDLENETTSSTYEARYCDPKEFFSVSDWRNRNYNNKATKTNPIYTIWGDCPRTGTPSSISRNTFNVRSDMYLYIAPYGNNLFENIPDPTDLPNWQKFTNRNPSSATFECYALPYDLYQPNDVLPIPYEFEETVILSTISRIFLKLGLMDKAQEYFVKVKEEQERLLVLLQERYTYNKQILESFIDETQRDSEIQTLQAVESNAQN